MDLIMAKHGLVSFIIHPDYVTEPKEQALYGELLGTLRTHHLKRNMWLALLARWTLGGGSAPL